MAARARPLVPHALELACRLAEKAPKKGRTLEVWPARARPAVAEGMAALARLVEHASGRAVPSRGTWALELARAYRAVSRALRVVALAERDAVKHHHAAPVRLPAGIEATVEEAALALLAIAEDGRDTRPAMRRRLSEAFWQLTHAAETLAATGPTELGPLAEALMIAYGEVAGVMIYGLALADLPGAHASTAMSAARS